MRNGSIMVAGVLGLSLLAPAVQAAGPEDAKAAFEHREDTMKKMGRALYTTIGRVVRGKGEMDQKVVEAAETIVSTAPTIETLFVAGSIVGDSKMKPEIFAAGSPRIGELVTGVKKAADGLLAAAKSGDKNALVAAYKVKDDACE
ncbi:MAG TPA: cytochrome c, partial [Stellaceae bacterium]|nr:cytochrome c [Stellaceae bacterium]